jgi:sortase B
MDRNAMFGEIGLFSDRAYFEARKYGSLYYEGRDHGLEFFAFLHVDAYDGSVFRTKITGQEEQEAYLNMILGMASHTRDIQVTTDDRIVLLSTCSERSTNGRDILVGRITDTLYDDPFGTDGAGGVLTTVDGLPGLWARTPLWAKAVIAAVILLILALRLPAALNHRRKRRRGRP